MTLLVGGRQRCDFEYDGYLVHQCEAPARFTISRADGDKTFSGGADEGVEYACPAHVAEALFAMASGDSVDLVVKLHYDEPTKKDALGVLGAPEHVSTTDFTSDRGVTGG